MIVDVPLPFRVRPRVPGRVPSARDYAEAVVVVEIPEVAEDEAPVALVAAGTPIRCRDGLLRIGVPVFPRDEVASVLAATLREFAAENRLHEMSEFLASSLLLRRAGELLVVGGRIHERAYSPILTRRRVEAALPAAASRSVAHLVPRPVATWFMDPADASAFLEAFRSRTRGRGPAREAVLEDMDVEIVDADAFAAARSRAAANTRLVRLLHDVRDPTAISPVHASMAFPPKEERLEEGVRLRLLRTLAERAADGGDGLGTISDMLEAATSPLDFEGAEPSPTMPVVEGSVLRVPMAMPVLGRSFADRGGVGGSYGDATVPAMVETIAPGDATEVVRHGAGAVSTWRDPRGWHTASAAVAAFRDGSGRGGASEARRFAANLEKDVEALSAWSDPDGDGDRPVSALWRPGHGRFADARDTVMVEFAARRVVDVAGSKRLRCPEPVLAVRLDAVKRTEGIVVSTSWRMHAVPGARPPFLFRLDHTDEAVALASALGMEIGFRRPPRMDLLRPDLLEFDPDAWNLKAVLWRGLRDLDGRVRFLDAATLASTLAVSSHLAVWSVDAAASEATAGAAGFLDHAGRVVDALRSGLFDDRADSGLVAFGAAAFDRLDARRGLAPPEDAGDYAGFSM